MALTARKLQEIERTYPEGLSSKQILAVLNDVGEPLTEATLRKYVQLGLLPRSRRVGQKGKHRGSRGIYPVEVIRRVDEIRRAMDQGDTLEELARAAQAVRAKLALVRVSMEEVLDAAEADLSHRDLDRRSKGPLRTELSDLKRDAKTWLKSLERWSGDLDRASQKNGSNGAEKRAMGESAGRAGAKKTASTRATRKTSGEGRTKVAGRKAKASTATRAGARSASKTKERKGAAVKAPATRVARRTSEGAGRRGSRS